MSPEYLEDLANRADPLELWRLSAFQQKELPPEQRQQLDAGVALRRHADDVRRLNALRDTGKSLMLTPLGLHGRAIAVVPSPAKHRPAPEGWTKEAVLAGDSLPGSQWVRVWNSSNICLDGDFTPEELQWLLSVMEELPAHGKSVR